MIKWPTDQTLKRNQQSDPQEEERLICYAVGSSLGYYKIFLSKPVHWIIPSSVLEAI